MLVRAVLIWCVLLMIASINGIAREAVLIPRFGDATGRAVSTLTLSAFIVILTWISIMANPWGLNGLLAPPLADTERLCHARAIYAALIERIHADGWKIEN
jgi:hypothetical protein